MMIIPHMVFLNTIIFSLFFTSSLWANKALEQATRTPAPLFEPTIFNFNTPYPSPCSDPQKKCYSIKDMVAASLLVNYESRQAVERLFQLKASKKMAMGSILPHVNFNTAYNDYLQFNPVASALDITSNLVGFLFPNRWLNWKASKMLVNAEIESMKTLYAERALLILSTYYYLQQQIWQIRVHTHYIDQTQGLIHLLHYQHDHGLRNVALADFGLLENIKGRQMYALAFINNLTATYPIIAYSMGMDYRADWTEIAVEPSTLTPTHDIPLGLPHTYYRPAEERSTEIANIRELLKASHLNKSSNYFDIFDPNSGNDLGAGYGQRIKVAKASIKIFEIQLAKTKAQIIVSVNNYLNNYNDALVALHTLEEVLPSLEDIKQAVAANVNNTAEKFDIMLFARYMDAAYWGHVDYVGAFYMFKSNEAGLARQTWDGPYFQMVLDYAYNELPEVYQIVKKSHSLKFKLFNKLKRFLGILPKLKKEASEDHLPEYPQGEGPANQAPQ